MVLTVFFIMSVEPTKDESVVTPKVSLEIEKPATVNNEVAATDKKVLPNGDVTVDIEAVSSTISMKQVKPTGMAITHSSAFP